LLMCIVGNPRFDDPTEQKTSTAVVVSWTPGLFCRR